MVLCKIVLQSLGLVVVQLPADALGKCQFVVDTSNTPKRAEIPVLWSGKNAGVGKRVP